jgi:predicted NodU family carbamoyl transferase
MLGGRVAAAAQEERFLRRGKPPPLPLQALNYCLQAGGITTLDLDAVVFHEKPFLKLARVLAGHLRSWPGSFGRFRADMPGWLKDGLCLPMTVREATGFAGPVFFVKRHLAQAAAAFFPSPFEEAAVLAVDDGGEWAVAARGRGAGLQVRLSEELRRPGRGGLGEEAVAAMARELRRSTGLDSLCLAATAVTDEAAGRRILERSGFKSIFVQTAAGDAAGALGAAAFVSHSLWGLPRARLLDPYLGPDFTAARIRRALTNAGLQGRELPEGELFRTAAALLAEGKSVGWFQGRMEFGPRSRGNRSILRRPDASAPGEFDEAAAERNPRLLGLIRAFRGLTGLPRLSGADLGAPLACTPEDAIAAFLSARLDALVLGDLVVLR